MKTSLRSQFLRKPHLGKLERAGKVTGKVFSGALVRWYELEEGAKRLEEYYPCLFKSCKYLRLQEELTLSLTVIPFSTLHTFIQTSRSLVCISCRRGGSSIAAFLSSNKGGGAHVGWDDMR